MTLFIHKLSQREAEISSVSAIELFSDLKLKLKDVYAELAIKSFYAKVVSRCEADRLRYRIRFTSAPAEVMSYFQAHQEFASRSAR